MPSIDRRSALASIGAVVLGGLAGCASPLSDEPPAGSLRFRNDHVVPHSITMHVTASGPPPALGAARSRATRSFRPTSGG